LPTYLDCDQRVYGNLIMKKRPKVQHYVAKSYLRGFATGSSISLISEVQIPAASTRASICLGPGRGVGTFRTRRWSKPIPSSTSARISAGTPYERLAPRSPTPPEFIDSGDFLSGPITGTSPIGEPERPR